MYDEAEIWRAYSKIFTLNPVRHLNRKARRYLYQCFMSSVLSRRTPRLAFPFTRPHFVFLFWGHVKCSSFYGKKKGKLKFCEEWKEAATVLLTQFSVMWKTRYVLVKQKYLLTQTGDNMQNRMWRRLIKQTNKSRFLSSIFSAFLSFIKSSVK